MDLILALLNRMARKYCKPQKKCVYAALDSLSPNQRSLIKYCGLTTQRSTVIAWNSDSSKLSPAISWQDTRGNALVKTLQNYSNEIHQLSGLPLSAHYGASKIRWLLEEHAASESTMIGPLASFLLHGLIRNQPYLVDHTNAQRLQLLDIDQLSWSQTLCDHFALSMDMLPACCPVQHRYGTLLDTDIDITAVCGDQNSAWFGEGTTDTDSALVNLGSGAFVLAEKSREASDDKLLTSIACTSSTTCEYLCEATVNGAGNALTWLQQKYDIEMSHPLLNDALDNSRSPALFLNAVGGLGSPWWNAQLEPGFLSSTVQYNVYDMVAGVLESILFLVFHNLERVGKTSNIKKIRVTGGLSNIDNLCQKLANLSGILVRRSRQAEASARGVAWLAAGKPKGWGIDMAPIEFYPTPEPELSNRYQTFIEQLESRLQPYE